MTSDDYISVLDWRRRPPLRLRVTKTLDICWCWIKCTRCPHMAAVAIVPYIIRWGPDGWPDMLRETAGCSACGKRGVAIQHPSWGGADTGGPGQILGRLQQDANLSARFWRNSR